MNTTMHLTDDQLDDILIGDPSAEAEVHLAACDACTARLAQLEAPIASFKAVSLAWSERRSSTLPAHPQPKPRRLGLGLAWGSAAVAILVAAAFPILHREQQRPATSTTATAPQAPATVQMAANILPEPPPAAAPSAREQEIAADNRMLAAIDRELSAPIATPATLGLAHQRAHTAPLQD
jgi:hypothetical protein